MKLKFEFFLIVFVMSLNASLFKSTVNQNPKPGIGTWIVNKMNEKQLTRLMSMHSNSHCLVGLIASVPFSLFVIKNTSVSNNNTAAKLFFALMAAFNGVVIGHKPIFSLFGAVATIPFSWFITRTIMSKNDIGGVPFFMVEAAALGALTGLIFDHGFKKAASDRLAALQASESKNEF